MITARGPSVRNPNSYRHGTGIVQTFRSIKTATVIITINARNFVAPRRIRAATQPPIALAVRNTTDARNDVCRWLWGNPLRDGQVGGILEDFHDDVHTHSDAYADEAIAAPKRGPDHGRDRTTGLTPKPTRRGE